MTPVYKFRLNEVCLVSFVFGMSRASSKDVGVVQFSLLVLIVNSSLEKRQLDAIRGTQVILSESFYPTVSAATMLCGRNSAIPVGEGNAFRE